MFTWVGKLSPLLFFIAVVSGCSSAKSTCSQVVATHPGMTCLDFGFGWYHAEFASMPSDQPPDHIGAAPLAPVVSSATSD
jgi:hypothetical protein